jgi:catechol 2,3-dioxygenase-like lactoylglutathione lyase family enzyme
MAMMTVAASGCRNVGRIAFGRHLSLITRESIRRLVLHCPAVRVVDLDHVVLRVSDGERSLAWYVDALGLQPERVDAWRAGEVPFPSVRINATTIIDLLPAERSGENVDHVCLVVDGVDLNEVATAGAFDVVSGPAEVYGARGTGAGLYVRDPDGNVVELRTY